MLELAGLRQAAAQHKRIDARFVDERGLGLVVGTRYLNQVCGFVLIINVDIDGITWILIPERHGHVLAHESDLSVGHHHRAYLSEEGMTESLDLVHRCPSFLTESERLMAKRHT